MSERVGLGESDADARWIGIRRHQAVLVILGAVIAGYGLMSPRAPLAEVVVGAALVAGAAPCYDGRTMSEQLVTLIRFLLRSHWLDITARAFGDDVVLWSDGEVAFRGYELAHRGRLDLSERDVVLADALAALADATSAARNGHHLSEHVLSREVVTTLLALPPNVVAPDGWGVNGERALDTVGLSSCAPSLRVLERLTYLRTPSHLARVYRVRDFSAVSATRGLLEHLLRSGTPFDLAVHLDVVAGVKAQRLAARAVHRVGSDDATSRAAGFRRTARTSRSFERLAQRETLVASGRALLRVAVFVVARADTLAALHERSDALWRHAHDGGLRLERGWGLQARWYRAHLPGGVGW